MITKDRLVRFFEKRGYGVGKVVKNDKWFVPISDVDRARREFANIAIAHNIFFIPLVVVPDNVTKTITEANKPKTLNIIQRIKKWLKVT